MDDNIDLNYQPHSFTPPPPDDKQPDEAAADVIRDKLARLYAEEPNAKAELAEAEIVVPRSKHQQYMHELNASGMNLAGIQTAWHNYYQSLPPHEQHQVWQEFYASQSTLTGSQPTAAALQHPQAIAEHKQAVAGLNERAKQASAEKAQAADERTPQAVQEAIRSKVSANGKLSAKHHLQSLFFGLGMGFVVVIIFLFSFFNEIIIAPFIQPSRAEASTPLIVSANSVAASSQPEVIIPKINVQIPTDFSVTSTNESDIENALEGGVVHYPTTAKPGENGNASFFGHSSNNIFNKGKYKFAFVLLHTVVPGDTFYLTNNGKVYAYKVFDKKVVDPSEVGVLNPIPGHPATATLITCDPPGTSLKRLVITGDQISPNPSSNAASSTPVTTAATTTDSNSIALPGNGPTLLGRLTSSLLGKAAVGIIVVATIALAFRWINKPMRRM